MVIRKVWELSLFYDYCETFIYELMSCISERDLEETIGNLGISSFSIVKDKEQLRLKKDRYVIDGLDH